MVLEFTAFYSLFYELDFKLAILLSKTMLKSFITYKCIQNKSLRLRYMKQNTDFQEGISQA